MPDKLPIEETNTDPTIPLTEIQSIRTSRLASDLATASKQGYIDAALAVRVLDFLKEVAPAVLGAVLP